MKLTKDEVLDIATTAVLRNRQLAGENEGLRIQIAKLKSNWHRLTRSSQGWRPKSMS